MIALNGEEHSLSTSSDDAAGVTAKKTALEIEKLNLEIFALQRKGPLESEKLRIETEVLKGSFARSLAIALLTAMVTVGVAWVGWHYEREKEGQLEQHQTIATAIGSLQSTDASIRFEALSLLHLYTQGSASSDIVAALTARAKREDDPAIFREILDTLEQAGSQVLVQAVDVDRYLVLRLANVSGQLFAYAKPPQESCSSDSAAKQRQAYSIFDDVQSPSIFDGDMLSSTTTSELISLLRNNPRFARAFERSCKQAIATPPATTQALATAKLLTSVLTQELADISALLAKLIASQGTKTSTRDFSNIVLLHAMLMRSHLRSYNLAEASLIQVELTGADLRCVNLGGADLRDVIGISGASFVGANIALTKMPVRGQAYDGTFPNFAGTDLNNAIWPIDGQKPEETKKLLSSDWTLEYWRLQKLCAAEKSGSKSVDGAGHLVNTFSSKAGVFDRGTEPE